MNFKRIKDKIRVERIIREMMNGVGDLLEGI